MNEELANLVHPVFATGLALRDRLLAGERPQIATEQAVLKSLLLSEREAQRWPLFGGAPGEPFLGVRYALVCWLDELFTLASPWAEQWNEHKLETALYQSNDRAWRFWEQAQLAETRPDSDPLEVLFLCVTLGFQGQLRGDPDQLRTWTAASQARVAPVQGREWPAPPELDPATRVPLLRGQERFQRMVLASGVALLLLVPLLTFLVVRKIAQ